MTTFATFLCDFEHEACGACMGCQTRTIPGTEYLLRFDLSEARLLEELKPRRGAPAMKSLKLRGLNSHKFMAFRAPGVEPVPVIHSRLASPWDAYGVSDDDFFKACDEANASLDAMMTQSDEDPISDTIFPDLPIEDDRVEFDHSEAIYRAHAGKLHEHVDERMPWMTEEEYLSGKTFTIDEAQQRHLEWRTEYARMFPRVPYSLTAQARDSLAAALKRVHRLWGSGKGSAVSLTGKYYPLDYSMDHLVNAVEITLIFLHQFLPAKNFPSRFIALSTNAKLLGTKINNLQLFLSALITAADWFYPPVRGKKKKQSMETQGVEEILDSLQGLLDKFDVVKTSQLYAKLYKFGSYALAMSLFAPLGITLDLFKFDKVMQEAMRKQYHMGPDFIHSLLDTALFLLRRGYQSYQAGSIMPMFHSGERYQAWFDEAETLQRQSNFLSNPEVHGIDRFKFMADLKDIIDKGRSMKKCAHRKEDRLVIGKILASLELIHDLEVTKRSAQKDRRLPLSFLLYGGSGIGKSTLQDVMFKHHGKVSGRQITPEYRYVRNSSDKFWSGFNSTQWCLVMDDIAFLNASLGILDPSLVEMLCVANNVPYVPLQAELSEKGRTPVLIELLLASTNTEDLNLHAYFSCPLAVQRRFPWVIDIKVRPEFQDPKRPGMLDSSRVPQTPEDQYPDFWEFTIKRVEPVGIERRGQKGKLVIEKICKDMPEFLRWYNGVIDAHNTVQDKIIAGQAVSTEAKVCETCRLPLAWCDCEVASIVENELLESDLFGEHEATYTQYLEKQSAQLEAAVETPAYINYTPSESMQQVLGDQDFVARMAFYWYYFLYKYVSCTWLNSVVVPFAGEYWFTKMTAKSPFRKDLARIMVKYAGKRTANLLSPHAATLAKMGVAMVSVIALYKTYGHLVRRVTKSVQANDDTAEVPNERPKQEYGDKWPFCRDDLSQTSLCSKGSDGRVLLANVERSLYVFNTDDGEKKRRTIACNLRGSVFMCNNHGIPPVAPFYLDVTATGETGLSRNVKRVLVTESMVHRVPARDLAFLRLRILPPGTDLTPWFANETYTGHLKGEYMGRDVAGCVWRKRVDSVRPCSESWQSHGLTVTTDMWAGIVDEPTVKGDCGSMLYASTNAGWVLLGIHTLGDGRDIRALKLNGQWLSKACDVLEPKPVARGVLSVSAPSVTRTVGPLSAQSVARDMIGVGDVLGSFVGDFRKRGKTYVTETLLAPILQDECGFVHTRTAPNMGRKPWALALKDMVRPVVALNMDTLGEAVAMYEQETFMPIQCSPYSMHVALNGLPGVEFCDKMPRKTSAGAPYKCSKQRFLIKLEHPDVDAVDEIKDTVRTIIAAYHRGERVHTVFCGQLKDEPVTFAKAECFKTRVFTMANMAQTIVTRMYLLPLVVHMQHHRFTYEAAVGVCAQSAEWEEAYRYLTKFGTDRMVAGDYAKFDKRMPASVILATFDIMLNMCTRAGYNEEDLAVVRGIAYDTAFPTVDFNGDLIEFYGSNPSGHALTVIVNSIANSLYMRYTYLVLRPVGEQRPFKQLVALWTYGDDNAMGVSAEAPWFNHTAVQQVLAEVDIEYTMADKEAQSVPYITIADTSFLKRVWRWEEQLGVHVAPLDLTSIEKMLMVCVAKPNVCAEVHAEQVLSTAVREYFFHGREVFEARRVQLEHVAHLAGLGNYVTPSTFPSWEQLCQDFSVRSRHVALYRELSLK